MWGSAISLPRFQGTDRQVGVIAAFLNPGLLDAGVYLLEYDFAGGNNIRICGPSSGILSENKEILQSQ